MIMNKIMNELKSKGYRITPQRKLLIKILVEYQKAISVAELYDLLHEQCPLLAIDTVYRNVNVLVKLGILMPISGIGKDSIKYELNQMQHHHHILCVDCGSIQCLDFCPIDKHMKGMIADTGYQLLTHNIELYGLCENCRKKRSQHE